VNDSTQSSHSAADDDTRAAKANRMVRRRLKTRARLLAATQKLLVEKGFDKMTMDDITEAADLGRRTLYYHFSSKEECVIAAAADIYRRYAASFEHVDAASSDPAKVIAMAAIGVLNALLDEPITARLVDYPKLLAVALDESIGQIALRDVAAGIEQRRFRIAGSLALVGRMMLWSLVGLINESVHNAADRDEIVQTYVTSLLALLGVPLAEATAALAEVRAQAA